MRHHRTRQHEGAAKHLFTLQIRNPKQKHTGSKPVGQNQTKGNKPPMTALPQATFPFSLIEFWGGICINTLVVLI
jgi:hypothetical protein